MSSSWWLPYWTVLEVETFYHPESSTGEHCPRSQAPAGCQALRSLVVPPSAARSSVRGSLATFGPVFEDQPFGLLFPEGSTEEKVTLACRARASPPANYR